MLSSGLAAAFERKIIICQFVGYARRCSDPTNIPESASLRS